MKKKLFALALAAALTVGSTVPAFASAKESVTATPTQTTTVNSGKLSSPEKKITITPTRTSPKTGQTDYALYGMLGAVAFGSVVVVSKKKNNEEA